MSETLAAPVVAVTVLEDRASITRRGTLAVRAGQQRVVLDRVSPVLADKTLTASATGARVLDVRCERYVAPWREGGDGTPVALRAERDRLQATHDAAVAKIQMARAESDGLGELVAAAYHDLAVQAARGVPAPNAQTLLAELDAQDRDARARRVDAEHEVAATGAALARLDQRIADAEAEAGEQAARLVIDLVGDVAGDANVTASYVVPGAAWRPYHRAELARDSGQVTWQTSACVWQATGEDWTDVELTCSLERPSLGVEPPALGDDELRVRKKPDTVVVEARDQVQDDTGLGASGPLQVPGIDDGGIGLRFSAARANVVADGTPHRIAVSGFTNTAQVSLVGIPLRSPWVHVRARIVNTGTTPLLAGPVDLIMASGYVGRAEVGFVAPSEKFYLGFGPEADVRMHRDETRERDDAGLLGGWNVQTVRIAVRLSNLGTQQREVTITERIPISEVEQVQVHASGEDAYELDEETTQVTARTLDDSGLVTWAVELPPLGRRAVTLEYRLKSQRGVVL
jgi:hypothetical protein